MGIWLDRQVLRASVFFFRFYGWDWLPLPGTTVIYLIFAVLWICAWCILLGWHYRLAASVFCLLFWYVELIDVTHYLNHYYLIGLLCGCMVFLPAHRAWSLDVWLRPEWAVEQVPRWTIGVLQLQIALVYFYAGVAKLQADWLWEAQPLRIWLARWGHLPGVGALLANVWTAYIMSWAGALYDLTIPFWLAWHRSRPLAYAAVVGFHLLTWSLFPIGVFPWLMMASATLFFSPQAHERFLRRFICPLIFNLSKFNSKFAPKPADAHSEPRLYAAKPLYGKLLGGLFVLHFAFQALFPLRHHCYRGNVLWTEEGFRFSWMVMLIEKQAWTQFTVKDAATGRQSEANNLDYLTEKQNFMMSSQPDLILQFAHFLGREYQTRQGYTQPQVFVRAQVALNGRVSQPLIHPELNLLAVSPSDPYASWVLMSVD